MSKIIEQTRGIINCFTIDLEDWYQGNEHVKMSSSHLYEDRIEYSTHLLLGLLEEYQIKVTFFVLGHNAEKKKSLIREIDQRGHEIASHGYSHELVYRQTPDEFRNETIKAKSICEDIIGKPILGYRASNWTITKESLWALDILREEGFVYDSSIFPTKNYLFGIPDSPRFSYVLNNGLLEIPPSTIKWQSITFPFSGGFYFRILPLSMICYGIRSVNQEGHPAVMYLHTWELDVSQPRSGLPIPLKNKIIHYARLSTVEGKLRNLLSQFKFNRMDTVFAQNVSNHNI